MAYSQTGGNFDIPLSAFDNQPQGTQAEQPFNASWYLNEYPEVAAHPVFGKDPQRHFNTWGAGNALGYTPPSGNPYMPNAAPAAQPSYEEKLQNQMPWYDEDTKAMINAQSAATTKMANTLSQYADTLPELAKQLPETLQSLYGTLMRQGMEGEGFQGLLNSLASRNILTSKVASDALAGAGRGVAQDISNKGYESTLAGLNAEMQIPGYLGQLMQAMNSGIAPLQQAKESPYRLLMDAERAKYVPYTLMSQLMQSTI